MPAHLVLLALLSLIGCASTTAPDDAELAVIRREAPHPFAVRVEARVALEDVDGESRPPLFSSEDAEEIATLVARSLDEAGIFLGGAAAEIAASEADAVLVVDVRARSDRGTGEIRSTSVRWIPFSLWLFAGFPGWLVDDRSFDPGVLWSYSLRRGTRGDEVHRGEVRFSAEDNSLSFAERASWGQYLQQVIVPAFVVRSDDAMARDSLRARYLERVRDEIARDLAATLRAQQLSRASAFPFLHVDDAATGLVFVLLSHQELQSAVLELDDGALLDLAATPILESDLRDDDGLRRLLAEDPLLRQGLADELYGYRYMLRGRFLDEQGLAEWTWTVPVGAVAPGARPDRPTSVARRASR